MNFLVAFRRARIVEKRRRGSRETRERRLPLSSSSARQQKDRSAAISSTLVEGRRGWGETRTCISPDTAIAVVTFFMPRTFMNGSTDVYSAVLSWKLLLSRFLPCPRCSAAPLSSPPCLPALCRTHPELYLISTSVWPTSGECRYYML